MAKFPSQNKILYETGNISDDNFVQISSGGTSGDTNIPKDLSILNRRGYASTTRKGVPLVYRCRVGFSMGAFDGSVTDEVDADGVGILRVSGAQNNWVMRNASVKWHAAREKMFARAGIPKKHRGAYAHEIRYNYDSSGDTWLKPIDGAGAAFAGGTWDTTVLHTEDDPGGFTLKLVGVGLDADSDVAATGVQIGQSYLTSRATVPDDSNLESSAVPGELSILADMLTDVEQHSNLVDDVRETAADDQDNPPYELITANSPAHDITEPVELGRLIVGRGNLRDSMVIDIPFGLCEFTARVTNAATTSDTGGLISLEVLKIFEMQG